MDINQRLLDVATIPKIEYDETQNDIIEENPTENKLSELIDTNIKGFSSFNMTTRNSSFDLLFVIKSGFEFLGSLQNDTLEKLITIDESLKNIMSFREITTDKEDKNTEIVNNLKSLNTSFGGLLGYFTDEDRKEPSITGEIDDQGIMDKISDSISGLSDKWKNFGKGDSLLDKALNRLDSALGIALGYIGGLFTTSFSTGILGTIWTAVKTYAPWVAIASGIANIFIDFYKSFKENGFSVQTLIDGVLNVLFSGGFFAMASKYSAIGAGIGAIGGVGVGAIPGAIVGGIVGMAMWGIKKIFGPDVFDKPKEIISNMMIFVKDTVSLVYNKIKDFMINSWETIKEKTSEIFESVKGFFVDIFNNEMLVEFFDESKEVLSGVFDKVKSLVDPVLDFFNILWNTGKTAIQWLVDKTLSGLPNFIENRIRDKFDLNFDEAKEIRSENEKINTDRLSYLERQILELKNENYRLSEMIESLIENSGNAIVQTNNTVKNDNVYQMPMTTPGSRGVKLNMQL